MTFAARLKALRTARGMTQEELALRCGWAGQSRVANYESTGAHAREPKLPELVKLANALGVTTDELLGLEPPQSQSAEVDLDTLTIAVIAVKEALKAWELELDAYLAAPMIAFAYRERGLLPRHPTKAELRAFDLSVRKKLAGELGNERRERPAVDEGSGSPEKDAPAKAKTGRGGPIRDR